MPYCATHTNTHGLAEESSVCSRMRSGITHTEGHITLKCLCLCLMNNICSHNNCLSCRRDGLCGKTKTKVVHRQSCTEAASSQDKKQNLLCAPDSNSTAANRKSPEDFRGSGLGSMLTPASVCVISVLWAVTGYVSGNQICLSSPYALSSTYTAKYASLYLHTGAGRGEFLLQLVTANISP